MAIITVNTDTEQEIEFSINLFEEKDGIDLNKVLRIDYNNLSAEKLTFPTIVSRLGILLANTEDALRVAELSYKIWKSRERERIRTSWDTDPDRPIVRGGKYTGDQVEDAIVTSKIYKVKKTKINRLTKEAAYMNTIYWEAKGKSDRLTEIKYDISLNEIDKLREFNGVKIKLIN